MIFVHSLFCKIECFFSFKTKAKGFPKRKLAMLFSFVFLWNRSPGLPETLERLANTNNLTNSSSLDIISNIDDNGILRNPVAVLLSSQRGGSSASLSRGIS